MNLIIRLSLLVFTYLAYVGLSAAQPTPQPSNQQLSPEELRLRDEWSVSKAQGAHRPRPLSVGDGNDISALAPTGFISSATGSFDSGTSVSTVNSVYLNGNVTLGAYTIQLNTNVFQSNGLQCFMPPLNQDYPTGCLWEQFVYENNGTAGTGGNCTTTSSCLFIQYWMYSVSPCPAGWTTVGGDCERDSTMITAIPPQPITNLGQLSMTASVTANTDMVTLSLNGSNLGTVIGDNSVGAAAGWGIAEFNVVGNGGLSTAEFNTGAQIVPKIQITYGGTAPPTCYSGGFTGETNNLSFPTMPPTSLPPPGPALFFIENMPPTPGTSICAASASIGDTHLSTFSGLFYDFQASGDFVVAQVAQQVVPNSVVAQQVVPNFVVQARQVSGAPSWPNAAVNHGIATQMGQTKVAVCVTPEGSPLKVNGENIALADGSVFSTPDVDIWRIGNAYNITDTSGNSVKAELNAAKTGTHYINVTVGLGRWPATVTGILANADGNVNQIATSGGTVLTAPFAFREFYDLYGESWRVPPEGSLLSACGEEVEIGNPQIPFYAIQLPPQLYKSARAVCTAAGVTGAALLDACTLDVAVIGDDAAAQVYVNARQPVAVGNIYIDPNQ